MDGQPQRMDRVPNARIRELCGVRKSLDERIDEDLLQWSTMWRGIGSPRESIYECVQVVV